EDDRSVASGLVAEVGPEVQDGGAQVRRVVLEQGGEGRVLPGLDGLDHGGEQSLARPEVVDEHAVAGADRGGDAPQALVADAVLGEVLEHRMEESIASRWHVPYGTPGRVPYGTRPGSY